MARAVRLDNSTKPILIPGLWASELEEGNGELKDWWEWLSVSDDVFCGQPSDRDLPLEIGKEEMSIRMISAFARDPGKDPEDPGETLTEPWQNTDRTLTET